MQKKPLWKHRQPCGAHLPCFCCCFDLEDDDEGFDAEEDFLFRMRTWPMQVTLGEEGSFSSWMSTDEAEALLRLATNMGLDREWADDDLPRLRLPPFPRNSVASIGAGSFSALPGLEETIITLEGVLIILARECR